MVSVILVHGGIIIANNTAKETVDAEEACPTMLVVGGPNALADGVMPMVDKLVCAVWR